MDTSVAREVVNAALKPMQWRLQLQRWKVTVYYTHLGEAFGTCTPLATQETAIIEIDNDERDDTDELLGTLRHELIHCMLADFETYRKSVAELLDDKVFNALELIFRHAVERAVANIENCLDHGLGHTPVGMAEPVEMVPTP